MEPARVEDVPEHIADAVAELPAYCVGENFAGR